MTSRCTNLWVLTRSAKSYEGGNAALEYDADATFVVAGNVAQCGSGMTASGAILVAEQLDQRLDHACNHKLRSQPFV